MLFTLQDVHGKTRKVGEDEVEGVDVLFIPHPRESFGGLDGLFEGFLYGFGAEAEFSPGCEVGEDIGSLVWLNYLS